MVSTLGTHGLSLREKKAHHASTFANIHILCIYIYIFILCIHDSGRLRQGHTDVAGGKNNLVKKVASGVCSFDLIREGVELFTCIYCMYIYICLYIFVDCVSSTSPASRSSSLYSFFQNRDCLSEIFSAHDLVSRPHFSGHKPNAYINIYI